jgi:hypothetical protein
MISSYQLEERLFDYFDGIYGTSASAFYFTNAASSNYMVGRYYDAVRPAASTLLIYDVNSLEPLGNTQSVDTVKIDRVTKVESVEILRKFAVSVNIISKFKGKAKDALSFLIASNQTTRGAEACYPNISASSFDIALMNIDGIKDLTEIENSMWTDRVEANFIFNFADTLTFGTQNLIVAPSGVELTKTKVDFDIELK